MNDSEALLHYQETLQSLADFVDDAPLVTQLDPETYQQLRDADAKVLAEFQARSMPEPEQKAPPPEPPQLEPGQIWLLHQTLVLPHERLFKHRSEILQASAGTPCYAVVTQVEETAPFGGERYREVQICPLSGWLELTSAEDLCLLPAPEHVLPDPLLIESWNPVFTLRLSLQAYLGHMPDAVLAALLQRLKANDLPEARLSEHFQTGPLAQFRKQERALTSYLQQPLDYLAELQTQSQAFGLSIVAQNLKASLSQLLKWDKLTYFPKLIPPASSTLSLAAAASESTEPEADLSVDALNKPYIYALSEALEMEVWLHEAQLYFRIYRTDILGQAPGVADVALFYADQQGQESHLDSDPDGIVVLPLSQLPKTSEHLLALLVQEQCFYFPLRWEQNGDA